MDVDGAAQRRRNALRILERAAQGHGFAQLFSDTSALAKDRDSSFEDQISVFYGLLTDLLELTCKLKEPVLRNAPLAKELELLAKSVIQLGFSALSPVLTNFMLAPAAI